ncbi:MAG: ParA family protein, partial [Anaerolineae bacterium]|nr:ParA family protein [Anaerolineae bacterium]
SIYHLVLWDIPASQCVLRVRPNLDILPSDKSILDAQGHLWRMNDDEAARQILPERLKDLDEYDFVLVDYSPSASILSESGMMYIRELIVPVSMNHFAVVGFVQVSKTLRDIGRIPDHNVRLSKIIPTFFDARRRKDREILESLQRRFPNTSPTLFAKTSN